MTVAASRCLVALALGLGFGLAVAVLAARPIAAADDSFDDTESQQKTLRDYTRGEERRAHFPDSPLHRALAPWRRFKKQLKEATGLDFIVSAMGFGQLATQSERLATAVAASENVGAWELFDDPRWGRGQLEWWLVAIINPGGVNGTDFQQALGSLWETHPASTDPGRAAYTIDYLWWRHTFLDGKLRVIAGKVDPSELLAQNRFIGDARESFISASLSAQPTLPFLGEPGLGGGAGVVSDRWHVAAAAVDADAHSGAIDFDSVSDGRWNGFGEIALRPSFPGIGDGIYRLTGGYTPKLGDGDDEQRGWGFAASFDQELGERYGAFLWFARGHGRVEELVQNLTLGLVDRAPLGWRHDRIGLACTWGKPADTRQRDQFGVETYWRFQLTQEAAITPDLQLIFAPSRSAAFMKAVFGLRMRIIL